MSMVGIEDIILREKSGIVRKMLFDVICLWIIIKLNVYN